MSAESQDIDVSSYLQKLKGQLSHKNYINLHYYNFVRYIPTYLNEE